VLSKMGYPRTSITDVIMTHLHHDHAGGIVSLDSEGKEYLTFPNAVYHIQLAEWKIAREPDILNFAAYDFNRNLKLLEEKGRVNLIEGDYTLCDGVDLKLVGGHTDGMQIVIINKDNQKYIYAGDIIATKFHTSMAVTSAYDVCRSDTVKAKHLIYDRLKANNGFLLLDHDTQFWQIPSSEIKV